MAPARISLLVETNSLLLLTGNCPLQPWKGAGISALFPAGESDIGEIPCIFPVDQGYGLRDEFATDWFLRHSVREFRDLRGRSAGRAQEPRGFAGFWARALANPNRRLRVPGLEDAAVGVCLCCQVGRFGFALDSPQQDQWRRTLPRRLIWLWVLSETSPRRPDL